MNLQAISIGENTKTRRISNTTLIILAFSSVFYSRIAATTIRFSLLNLLHFAIIPLVCAIALSTTRTRNPKQISLCLSLLTGLLVLFGVTIASAFWNHAGLINAIVSFMMLGEPFMFLLAMSCISISTESFKRIKNFLYWSALINFLLAVVQKPLIDSGRLFAGGLNGTDGCGGVFFVSGAGNYVSATISLMITIFLFTTEKKAPLPMRIFAAVAALWHILFSDSKQLVLTYGVAWVLLILVNSKDIGKTLKLVIGLTTIVFTGMWCVENLPAFKSYTAWARPELYGSDGLAWYAKLYSFHLILDNYQSPLNWLFGLGPGHTVSRLGAWFLRDYASLLGPLGSTSTSIGQQSMDFVAGFWLTSGSSLFSPIFGWVGIWGDLGLLGLAAYIYLGYLVWQNFCLDDGLKTTLLSVFVIGWIFTQMEEPGYMISTALILGIPWQERHLKERNIR
ncbi:hypothetical protein H6G76_01180 [Nostoc sp. FACHB-152]|uniref:hypothetical protein n=1 Tax=unclassified Nostoc TaxID=2593658 RepID=UPI00168775A5|nr:MULTISPECIES: hypothetical protein [unclassified Nostoc]MBD2445783.1 hypothetical protein [Nostoc sp. FACHB-152]MBD2466897.1 hypothetical protein [Nostoc sp. FACHB-145]